ncbi:VirB3 family type IV secretion system protein [Treponema pedis]|uniref:VirB3 family type IV secretion system protein n=1 Tax=Treponema pedis TaxID=409322 RepID=UPI000466B4F5|nr:VirB3 family type IV secretion system protein [Treponema pedis]
MKNSSLTDFKLPVHRSLLSNDMLFGIGTTAATMLLVFTIIMLQIVGWWILILSVGLFVLFKILCKEDPYLLEILFSNILEQDFYYG